MIDIRNLFFSYELKEQLFTDLELQLPSGNIYGLLGKNGAGKTTLLKIITGLLFPKAGDCSVMGFEPRARLPRFLEEVYFISEEFFVPPITTKEFEKAYAPFYPRFDKGRFLECLDEFDLTFKKKLSAMSYGQKKKFLLAFGLATNCRLLILDEPTNGLDIPTKSQFRKLLASSLTADRSFIVSTHQVRDLEQLIDPVIILDNGKIIFQRHVHEVGQALSCQLRQDVPDEIEVLYSEKVLGGYTVVVENTTGEEAGIDLETLFNAVVTNKVSINRIFENRS